MGQIEIRGFGDLKKLFDERKWTFPLIIELKKTTSALALARKLNLPIEKIETVLINGKARNMDYPIKPGDRVAFVPPGIPGPYRVLLGFVQNKWSPKD